MPEMRAAEYREYAVECMLMAKDTTDPARKMMLLDMAQSWAILAEQAAKNHRLDLVYETPPSLRDDYADG